MAQEGQGSALAVARVLAEVDEAMWLRAREGDVAAAKVIYARLASLVPPPAPPQPPSWEELQALLHQVQSQQKELENGVLDDVADVRARANR